ncbi:hypothetical protein QMK17_24545 [Rhodococcus sp. G-MC3]|nr:hypothetical protein [Rhodococcus sp. G-MC3]MDJ0396477.1 hypothetical protein [Rhodococcus sp. G-MC3]
MTLSCGAALDHLVTAAVALRWSTHIDMRQITVSPQRIASITFEHNATPQSHEFDLLTAISHRRSDRRLFGQISDAQAASRPIRDAAARYGAALTVLGPDARETLAAASIHSAEVRKYDPDYQAELRWWAGHSFDHEGIPPRALNNAADSAAVQIGRRFPVPRDGDVRERVTEDVDESTVLLLSTETDTRHDWVQSGRALSAILLEATAGGLATCTLTHLTEQSGSRTIVRSLADAAGVPQVLIRIGKPSPGPIPKQTPRLGAATVLTDRVM